MATRRAQTFTVSPKTSPCSITTGPWVMPILIFRPPLSLAVARSAAACCMAQAARNALSAWRNSQTMASPSVFTVTPLWATTSFSSALNRRLISVSACVSPIDS